MKGRQNGFLSWPLSQALIPRRISKIKKVLDAAHPDLCFPSLILPPQPALSSLNHNHLVPMESGDALFFWEPKGHDRAQLSCTLHKKASIAWSILLQNLE